MTSDPAVQVRGGVAGTTVGLDELLTAAGRLTDGAEVLGGVVARLVVECFVVGASAALSPMTAARAEAELVDAIRHVAVEAAELVAVATTVRAAALAYGLVEDEIARSAALAQDAVMAVAGHGAPTLVVGVVVLEALGVDVADVLDRAVWTFPEVAELGGGTGGLVVGLGSNPVTAPFVSPFTRIGGVPDARTHWRGERDADQAALAQLADAAGAFGLLEDADGVRVTEVAPPADSAPSGAPRGIADLAGDVARLPGDSRIRVVEVSGESGPAWVVEIAGTQVWSPRAGENPFDVTTDVRSMAAESTVLAAGVQQALAAAQTRAQAQADTRARPASGAARRDVASEPVLLAGHSLGGIVAAALASSGQFRSAHRVTHVVALGAPIGRAPVPSGVQVLAIEHEQDPVPRLEGRSNPDRPNWVTVTRDLDGTPGQRHRGSEAHRSDGYAATAAVVDATVDPSVAAWRKGASAFFEGHGDATSVVVRDYRIARVVLPP